MQVCTGIPIWITRPTPSIHNMNCRIRTIYPSTLSTPQTIRNTHNIIETTHLLCFIQMILDSTLLVSKIISINIVSMIYAPIHPEYPQYYRDDSPTMYDPNDPRQYTARQQDNQHQHRQYDTGSYHPDLPPSTVQSWICQ